MKNRFSLLGFCSACLLLLAWENALGALSEPAPNQCIVCHSQLEGILEKPVEDFKISVNNKWNLSCSDCHGGNPAEPDKVKAKAEGTNYVGKPKPADVPAYCGRCHSDTDYMRKYKPSLPIDQQEKYFTSHHGEQLQQGNETVAQCVSCHGSHAILPPDDPLSQVYPLNIPKTCAHCHADPETMKASGLATDQYEKYAQSAHGKALYEKGDIMGAPTCNDCHGNHGATPPAITSVANVCGTCHVRNREFFAHSRHKEVFDEAELPECSTCHSYHLIIPTSDAMLGTGPESLCMECHEEGDTALQVAASMTHLISSLDTSGKYAEEVLHQAEQKGMLVDDGFFLLKTIRERLIDSRTYIHTFHVDDVSASISEGMDAARKALVIGETGLKDYHFRRNGFAISSIIVTMVALALFLKIREIDSRNARSLHKQRSSGKST